MKLFHRLLLVWAGVAVLLLSLPGYFPTLAQGIRAGFGYATDGTGELPGAKGGTGVANTGKTITLGGNLTTSGANPVTFTTTGSTNVTLPQAGTAATLAGTETLTNKAIGQLTNLTSNGFVKTGSGNGTLSVDTSTYLTSVTAHNLLSATHGDTLTDSVVRGDILYGNSTPKWARLGKPSVLSDLSHDGTDVSWVTATGTGAPVRAVSPSLTTPAFSSFANAPHDHTNAAGGGKLPSTALNGDLGYSLQFAAGGAAGYTIADSTTYYFGNQSAFSPNTTAGRAGLEAVLKAGTITGAAIYTYCVGNGSAEDATVSVSINESTTVTISTAMKVNAGVSTRNETTNFAMSQAVSQGDRLQIKIVAPNYATNPTNCYHNATVWIHQS